MKHITFLVFLFGLSSSSMLNAQETTVGLLSLDATQTYEGYNLIYPHNQPNIFLLNNCGEIVHKWEDEDNFRPGNTAYLRPDGSIVKTKRDAVVTGDAIWAGGGGAFVEIRDWDNNLLWSFEMNNDSFRLHHDIAPLPNGNILMLAWELKTREEAEAMGRLPELLAQDNLWPEYVFEINPTNDEIVWEWHVWDHMIQDVDAGKPNFGIIADHKELIDINYDEHDGSADWMHANAMSYNAELDQIMLSIPYFNELWVIDHSTTTEQAAGHSGGFVNSGGDLIYRWGNPEAYNQGDSTDKVLFFQHDTHWANEFVPLNHPNANDIIVFNNRVGEDFSTVEIIKSGWDMYNSNYESFNGRFLPDTSVKTITHPTPQEVYSTGLSSAQLLPNGNMLICSGRQGYMFELTPDNEIVWEYKTPIIAGQPIAQGTELSLNNNLTFRAFRYPTDYEAFDGRDLSPQGYIELEPITDYCNRLTSTSMPDQFSFAIYPNPTKDILHFKWDTGSRLDLRIVDALGRTVKKHMAIGGMTYIDVSDLQPNMYFIVAENYRALKLIID